MRGCEVDGMDVFCIGVLEEGVSACDADLEA
jgi:hypothetical protein